MTEPAPNADRFAADFAALSAIRDDDRPGWTRPGFTEFDVAGREWVAGTMRMAGLDVRTDGAGNVIGQLAGRRGGRTLMTGSHTDTVDGGGRFDGIVGLLGAIEMVRALREADVQLDHDLTVVNFFSEEANPWGLSMTGSSAMTGQLRPDQLAMLDENGRSMADALLAVNLDPNEVLGARSDLSDVDAFIELHIEQGPHLESVGTQIGLVDTITGIARFAALFGGRADHAGTTPMNVRHDACCAAAATILAVEQIGSQHTTTRGTCGNLKITPEATNVITAAAEVRGEFRGPDREWLTAVHDQLTSAAAGAAAQRGVSVDVDWLPLLEPAPMTPRLIDRAGAVIDRLGFSRTTMFSGAGHDAAVISDQVPTAMLFVPSHDGRSHCPDEWTELDDIMAGVTALTHLMIDLDRDATGNTRGDLHGEASR